MLLFGDNDTSWATKTFRIILLWLDAIVYKFVALIYRVFVLVSNARLFDFNDENTIGKIVERIYTVLGVAMLFVFAYNIILLISNPDKISDNGDSSLKGLVKNTVISIAAIALLPTIFNYMQIIQMDILESNVIGNIIMGGGGISGNTNIQTAGTQMALNIFSAFFHPIANIDYGDGNVVPGAALSYNKCQEEPYINDVDICDDYVNAWNAALSTNDLERFIDNDQLKEELDADNSSMKYYFVIPTAVGALVGYLLVSFTFDVAVRAVKLSVLQLIAPFPIIMRITKPNGGIFDKWFKQLKDTYIMVFLRLATIYFAVFMIQIVIENIDTILLPLSSHDTEMAGSLEILLAQVFIIVGLLVFAKQAPKLIESLIGSISGGTWRISKKLNGEDYEFARRAAVGAGALGGNVAKGLGRLGVNAFYGRNDKGELVKRWGEGGVGKAGLGASLWQGVRDLPTTLLYGTYRGIRDGGGNIQNFGQSVSQAMNETDQRKERNRQLRKRGAIGTKNHKYAIPFVSIGLGNIANGFDDFVENHVFSSATNEAFDSAAQAFAKKMKMAIEGLTTSSAVKNIDRAYDLQRDDVTKKYGNIDGERRAAVRERDRLGAPLREAQSIAKKYGDSKDGREFADLRGMLAKFEKQHDEIKALEASLKDVDLGDGKRIGSDTSLEELERHRDTIKAAGGSTTAIDNYISMRKNQAKSEADIRAKSKAGDGTKIEDIIKTVSEDAAAYDDKTAEFKTHESDYEARVAEVDSYDETIRQRNAELKDIEDARKEEKTHTEYGSMWEDEDAKIVKSDIADRFRAVYQGLKEDLKKISPALLEAAIKRAGFGNLTIQQVFQKFIDGDFNEKDYENFKKLQKEISKAGQRSELRGALGDRRRGKAPKEKE